jgi:hypothetical protein
MGMLKVQKQNSEGPSIKNNLPHLALENSEPGKVSKFTLPLPQVLLQNYPLYQLAQHYQVIN